MTGTPQHERPAMYELTVSGPIGPVIRSALRPHSAAPSRAYTILRIAAIRPDAVPDLMLLLDRRGLDVEGVFDTGSLNHQDGGRARSSRQGDAPTSGTSEVWTRYRQSRSRRCPT
ncbi:MAG TPA: hypothetical protein VFZ32_10680 [Micromonosporaceae bacterium]